MKTHLNRRALLQGLGTVGIGLPLLEEMITTNALGAAPVKVAVRAFNVFFGLGIPSPLQTEGFDDVLEPLQPLSKKLLIMRNVDHVRCDVRVVILINKCPHRFANQSVHILANRISWFRVVLCRNKFVSVFNAKHLNHLAMELREVINLWCRLCHL